MDLDRRRRGRTDAVPEHDDHLVAGVSTTVLRPTLQDHRIRVRQCYFRRRSGRKSDGDSRRLADAQYEDADQLLPGVAGRRRHPTSRFRPSADTHRAVPHHGSVHLRRRRLCRNGAWSNLILLTIYSVSQKNPPAVCHASADVTGRVLKFSLS